MLGRFDEARAILAEARAELAERGGGIRLAVDDRRTRPSTSSSWPAIPPPPPSSEQKGAGCSRSWGNRASCRPRPRSSAQALYALDRLEEADAWAGRAAELGASDDASRRCSGGRSGRRCSRAAASTPRRSGSRARRWRSARRPTCSTRRATRTPTSPRCSCSAGKPDEAAAALEQALERYERKGNLVSTERAQTRLAAIRQPARR